MQRFEKLITAIILGGVFPIFGFLLLWAATVIMSLPEWFIALAALTGFVGGLVIDVIYLKRWIKNAYTMDLRIAIIIYLFYSSVLLGFFMGVPVFNVLLAIPAGIYIGNRLSQTSATPEEFGLLTRKTCIYTTFVLLLVCTTSGAIALSDPYTIDFFQTLLPVSITIRQWMLASAMVTGGLLLLSLQWVITGWVIRKTVTFLQLKNIR